RAALRGAAGSSHAARPAQRPRPARAAEYFGSGRDAPGNSASRGGFPIVAHAVIDRAAPPVPPRGTRSPGQSAATGLRKDSHSRTKDKAPASHQPPTPMM